MERKMKYKNKKGKTKNKLNTKIKEGKQIYKGQYKNIKGNTKTKGNTKREYKNKNRIHARI